MGKGHITSGLGPDMGLDTDAIDADEDVGFELEEIDPMLDVKTLAMEVLKIAESSLRSGI